MPKIKEIWNDFYSYAVYQGQQDYYKYPFYKRIIPAIEYILITLIALPIAIIVLIYYKLFIDWRLKCQKYLMKMICWFMLFI